MHNKSRIGLAALLLVSACGEGTARTSERTDSFRGVSALVVDHEIGSVSITRGDGVTVARTVRDSSGKRATERTRQDGSTLRVGAGCPSSFNADVCSVDYRITAPAGVTVSVKAGANAVAVAGLTAAVDVTTDSGAITLKGVSAVRASTRSGRIDVSQSGSGQLDARSDSGPISIRLGPGESPVTASATSGDIRVVAGGGPCHVTARSRSGRTEVGVRRSASGRSLTLTTDSGDITVS